MAAIFLTRCSSTNGPFLTERAMAIWPFFSARYIYPTLGFCASCILWSVCPKESWDDYLLNGPRHRHADDRQDFWRCRGSSAVYRTSEFFLLFPMSDSPGPHFPPVPPWRGTRRARGATRRKEASPTHRSLLWP